MKITSTKFNPIFQGYSAVSKVPTSNNLVQSELTHTTMFMRNLETLKFTKNYIKDNFPQGTDIVEFGCSAGHKPYSLLVMLDKINHDKKYKVTGYDFPSVIAVAEQGKFEFNPNNWQEKVIIEDAEIRETFAQYFEAANGEDFLSAKEKSYILKPIEAKTKGLIDFKVGNILDIKKTLAPEKNGVIIFQNALYHILYQAGSEKNNLNTVNTLFKDIYDQLPPKGIFILGSLSSDHYADTIKISTSHKYQDNKLIEIINDTPVHQMLKDKGFKPIFYEISPFANEGNTYYPAVWQKT